MDLQSLHHVAYRCKDAKQTTEFYTRVSIRALKEVHTATHPSARLRRRKGRPTIVLDEDVREGEP